MYWVVRESVRKAMAKAAMKFNSREELIEGAKRISDIKYNFDNSDILKKSRLLETLGTQKRLGDYF